VQGFLNLNKPAGFTSHDCIAKLRRLFQLKRIGHAGTLDPMATGVLPVAIGRATRLLQFLPGEKAYRAKIRFGLATATDDITGEVLTEFGAAQLELEQVLPVLPQFCGQILQLPPNYSAVQVQGKRLYDLARQGKAIDVAPRQVEVYKIEVLNWQPGEFPELDVAIWCGAGTYIRSIARDLGALLGVGATLAALERTLSSGFQLESSLDFADLETELAQSGFTPIDANTALQHLPILILSPDLARRWCQGQKLSLTNFPNLPANLFVRVMDESSALLGVAEIGEEILRAKVVLVEEEG
jgi:tRNA pseudouridine55 synthase